MNTRKAGIISQNVFNSTPDPLNGCRTNLLNLFWDRLIVRFNALELHLGCDAVEGFGLILTGKESLMCTEISAHGCFRFSPSSGK